MVDRAKDERFMRMALQEAKEAFDADEIPVELSSFVKIGLWLGHII